VAVTPELARAKGWSIGSRFEVASGSRRVELCVGALVDFKRVSPLASSRMVVMDIAQAQSRLGVRGGVHQIDVQIVDGVDVRDVAARLGERMGAGARVVTPEQRRQEAQGLMGAFRLNLTALSLISLFVGGFLVYASTQAALVRRRAEFGVLRAIGASRRQVLGLVMGEVALLGLLGTAVGIPLGWLAARANVGVVSATLSNLYLLREIEALRLPPSLFLLAIAMGLAGAIAGAAGPALELARAHPRSLLAAYTLHERVGGAAGALAGIGVAGLAVALAVWWFAFREWKGGGWIVGVAVLLAVPLLAPLTVRAVAGRIRPASFAFAYGVRTLRQRLHTTFVAVAALSVAVAMLVGITLMIGSFRRTVDIWLDSTTIADIYVTTESWRRARSEAWLAPEILEVLRADPDVRAVDTLRQLFGSSGDRSVVVGGFDVRAAGVAGRFSLLDGDPQAAFAAVRDDGAAWVSEPLALKDGLRAGGEVRLWGPDGEFTLPVAGVYRDYSTERGGVLMDLATFERHFGPGPVQNAALFLKPGVDPDVVVDRLRDRLAGRPLEIRSNRALRDEVMGIFDQTFAVTRLLQGMSLLIAAAGITLTLLVLARERIAELALYRALGASRGQIFAVFVGKGLGLALFGLALGALGGVGLAVVLVYLINRAYFGWTIAMHWPWGALARQTVTILLAALLASLYPAMRASRTPATELSRENL
jgi:putative ABC transport system permease protein